MQTITYIPHFISIVMLVGMLMQLFNPNVGMYGVIYKSLTGTKPAEIDGASRLQRMWSIELPAIVPIVVIHLIMNCGSILGVGFQKIYLMQNDLNIRLSEVISTYSWAHS